MRNHRRDPVLNTIHYAAGMTRLCDLEDVEAALYAAAFALYGPIEYQQFAKEAAYYLASKGGIFTDAIIEAYYRRMRNGTYGSQRTTVGV